MVSELASVPEVACSKLLPSYDPWVRHFTPIGLKVLRIFAKETKYLVIEITVRLRSSNKKKKKENKLRKKQKNKHN